MQTPCIPQVHRNLPSTRGLRAFAALCAVFASASLFSDRAAAQVIIADSVTEFSGVQGQDNWYYQNWYQPLGFVNNMIFDADSNQWLDSSGRIFEGGSHPHSTDWRISQVWVSEVSETIRLTGSVSLPSTEAYGVIFQIVTNYNIANLVYSQSLGATESYNFDITFDVSTGDSILFTVMGDGGISFDNTLWDAQISTVPEPHSAALALAGMAIMAFRRRRAMATTPA